MDDLTRIPIPRDLFEYIDQAAMALREEHRFSNNKETKQALIRLNVVLACLVPVEVKNAS